MSSWLLLEKDSLLVNSYFIFKKCFFKVRIPSIIMEKNKGFKERAFATKAIHVGQSPKKWRSAALVPPIFTAATYELPASGVQGVPPPYYYSRCGNPTRDALEECLAGLEGAKYASTYASGLAAITSIISLLKNGDHIVSGDDIYGGTNILFREIISEMGIDTTFAELTTDDLTNFKSTIKANTKLIWMESPTNPTMKLVDIAAVVKVVKSMNSDIIVVVDNTFLTPYLQKPLDFGADIVIYSLTKYMNGHSDVVMGAALTNSDELGRRLKFLQIAMGAVPSPMDCYLVNRGLKTLALRMEQHKKSSLIIAQWLGKHPKISEVLHPGLPSHPRHEIAKKQSSGHSGMLSFRHVGTLVESQKFLNALEIITHATSLGGFETLAQIPALISHKDVPEEKRAEFGITNSLIRMTVGLEDTEDLLQDLEQALDAAFK